MPFYKKLCFSDESESEMENEIENEDGIIDNDDEDEEIENDDTNSESFSEVTEQEQDFHVLQEGAHLSAIAYVRSLMKFFKKSPKKNSELQQSIKAGEGKELSVLLDIRIRWNSLLPMIERYLRIKSYMRTILEDYNEGQLFMTRHDDALKELVDTLQPLNEAVILLSKRENNIMVAEGAITFVLEKLGESKSNLSKQMADAVVFRYNQRRNKDLLSLLLTLHTTSYPSKDPKSPTLDYSSQAVIKKTAQDLLRKLSPEVDEAIEEPDEEMPAPSDIHSGINKFLSAKQKPKENKLDKDFKLLESRGELTARLSLLSNALMSIRPTSTTCEQAFSVAGNFKTKIRNRMAPKSLNAMVLLKYHFAVKEN